MGDDQQGNESANSSRSLKNLKDNNRSEQNQKSVVGKNFKIANSSTNISLVNQINTSSSISSSNSKSIISLSKLKDYMPQNNSISNNISNNTSSSDIRPVVYSSNKVHSNSSPSSSSLYSHIDHQNKGERTAQARTFCTNPNQIQLGVFENNRSPPQHQNLEQNRSCYQLTSFETPLKSDRYRLQHQSRAGQRNSIPDICPGSSSGSLSRLSAGSEEAELQQTSLRRSSTIDLDTLKEDRKRKRSNYTSTDANGNKGSIGRVERREEDKVSVSLRNNMTPSSLLSLQSHSYLEHQQLQHCMSSDDSNYHQADTVEQQQQQGKENDLRIDQQPIIEGKIETANQDQNCTNQDINSPSTSSPMLNTANQFKTLDSASNTSKIQATSTSSIANLNAFNYSSNSSQLSDTTVSVDGFQQNYHQQSPTSHELKNPIGSEYFHYGGSNGRMNCSDYRGLPASMLGQQIKFDSSVNNGSILENRNALVIDHRRETSGSSSAGYLTAAKVQHQARTHLNQYYQSHYNFLPTSSSKSSSPTSSSSTPPPKALAIHSNTSQNSNQHISNLVTSSSASAVQNRLDQLSQHYINDGGDQLVTIHHYPNQMTQSYAYNQQSVAAHTQDHSNTPGHEQLYDQHHSNQTNHQQQVTSSHQAIYHHLANNSANVGMNHIYGGSRGTNHYQSHIPNGIGANHQHNHHLTSGVHQGNLNSAAAHAAAAVVSQTLKTVANQSSYGSAMTNGFGTSAGNIMNISSQHQQALNSVNHLNHSLSMQGAQVQPSNQGIGLNHAASATTRKYQCKMCPQVFLSKAEMKYHNKNHMQEAKPYKCLQCTKAFANSSYLSQHMRIHQGDKRYSCDICSRKFTQLSHLQQHKRTHTGEKPYKCNHMNCTKKFSQLSNLQSHSRCHQLDKPYKCNSCYKCFHDEPSLLEHIPRHLESKHVKKNLCIFCGSSYQQERGLVKHFQQYHTDKTPTLVAAAIAAGTTGNTTLIASLVSRGTNSYPAQSSCGVSTSMSNLTGDATQGSGNRVTSLNSGSSSHEQANRYNMFG